MLWGGSWRLRLTHVTAGGAWCLAYPESMAEGVVGRESRTCQNWGMALGTRCIRVLVVGQLMNSGEWLRR